MLRGLSFKRLKSRSGRSPRHLSTHVMGTIEGLTDKVQRLDAKVGAWSGEVKGLERKVDEELPEGEFHAALSEEGRTRNRYNNVLANESTRVKLQPPLHNGSDYINANYVAGGVDAPRRYIAAQAPLEDTVADFWQMVWDNGVEMIIMLTQLVEKNAAKADQYWPKSGAIQYGRVVVTRKATTTEPFWKVRTLALECDGQVKTVKQVHFSMWPDHGVPRDPKPIEGLLDHMDLCAQDRPIVLHCSAGLGRTGTLIAIHILSTRLRESKNLDVRVVQDTVTALKKQRDGMVQTGEQYRFIHTFLQRWTET